MENQTAYLKSLMEANQKWQSLESYAATNQVPIMDEVSMDFVCQLVNIQQPTNILEIGTAIGYSAIRMASKAPSTHIITLERNQEMIDVANNNINKFGLNNQIEVLPGDAVDHLINLQQTGYSFDFVFIDAAKAQYENFFKLSESLLQENGLIVCDNVLFRGFVANPEKAESPRLQKIANKINHFNTWLMNHKGYDTSIIPIGDGISISKKLS